MITANYQRSSPTGWLSTGDQLVANVQMQSNNAG
jgi:hypothetical protein